MAELDDKALRATLAISQQEAQAGTSRTLTLPGGRLITITVPAGAHTGQEIRLDRQGLSTADGNAPGTLIVTIAVAPAENFEPLPSSQEERNAPTELLQAPPPPGMQPSYSSVVPVESYPYYSPSSSLYNNSRLPSPYTQYPPQYTQGQQYYPYPAKKRSIGITILLATCAFLAVVVGILVYYAAVYQPNQFHAQATATARAQLTGTAVAARATTQAQMNATHTALAETPQTLYDQITNNTPTVSGTIQSSNLNWDTGAGCAYQNSAYDVIENNKGFFAYCTAQSANFSNLAYQVRMKFIQGSYGGIILRADATNSKFYLFRVSQNGFYDLYYYPDNTGKTTKTLASGSTDFIKADANNIAVIARGRTFYLYINRQYLASAVDASMTSGQIGVIADAIDGATIVAYDQVQVWQL